MTVWNGNLTNQDGLIVKFGNVRGTAVKDGVSGGLDEQTIMLYVDSQNLVALASAAREDVASIPADKKRSGSRREAGNVREISARLGRCDADTDTNSPKRGVWRRCGLCPQTELGFLLGTPHG